MTAMPPPNGVDGTCIDGWTESTPGLTVRKSATFQQRRTGYAPIITIASPTDFRDGRAARCGAEYGRSSNGCHAKATSPAREHGIVGSAGMTRVVSPTRHAEAYSRQANLRGR